MQRDVGTLVRVRGASSARHAAVSSVSQAAEVAAAAGDGSTCSSTTPAWALGQRLCASLVAVFTAGLKRRAAFSVDDDGQMAAAPKRARRDTRRHEAAAEARAAAASGVQEDEVEEEEETQVRVCVCVGVCV